MNTFLSRCAFTLGMALGAYGIDPTRAMSQYVRDRWGAENGFPRGPVYAITQTTDGYLWIGTERGLVRFDGLNFRLIEAPTKELSLGHVLGLEADIDGSLWIRLRRPTLLRYRDGEFRNVMADFGRKDANVAAMSKRATGSPLFWVLERDGSAIVYHHERFETLARPSDLALSAVLSIAETPSGDVWIGTRDAGLFRLKGGQTSAIRKGLPDTKINSLLATKNGDLWVGTDAGIARWTGTELTQSGVPPSLARLRALAMTGDRDSNVWIGTNSAGLVRVNERGASAMDTRGSGEAVTAVFEDREGDLWTGSANGIERLRDSAFVTYGVSQGMPSERSGPVYVDSERRTWFGPSSGGLYWLSDGHVQRVAAGGIGGDVVYSIAGRNGELWIGRQRGGLTHLRPGAGSFSSETFTHSDGLAQNSVYSVYQTRNGTVWAGTLSGGISKLSGGKFTTYTSANGLASDTVDSILEDSDGTMWFGTPNGLSALANDRWQAYSVRDGLPSENVNCFLEDSAHTLWVGTAAGLAYRSSGSFRTPLGLPASMREQILGLAEDGKGSLWIATSNHVLRVTRDKLLRGELGAGDVHDFGIADGLHGTEGVKRHRSVVAGPQGRIWFSMNRGLSVADPARLTGTSAPAIVHIQTVAADGNAVDTRLPVRISVRRQRIIFSYAGLSLSVPERVRFRYTLDGYDHGWSEPVAAREAAYTNLSPGTYRFRVIASNPDGVWNGTEAAISFVIDPAFWQTWWFRTAILLACALGIVAVYRFRLHHLTRQLNVRFEERLSERTRIAQELHDTLLQGFLSASMQLHVAADRLPPDSPAAPTVNRVLQLMTQVIEEGRNTLRGLRSSSGEFLDLQQAFSRIRQELSADEATAFRVIVDGQPRPLHPILRDEVYRIGRESLVNAFRHSRARSIEVEVQYAPRQLRVLVRDNGCGIDPNVLQSGRDGHWGLAGMRERAERIGAQLHVWSSATAGTEVELSVPGHIAFRTPSPNRLMQWLSKMNRRVAGDSAARLENGPSKDGRPKNGEDK